MATTKTKPVSERELPLDAHGVAKRTGYTVSYVKQLSRTWEPDAWLNGGRVWWWDRVLPQLPPEPTWPINKA